MAKFQRRHYTAIADALRELWNDRETPLMSAVEVSRMAERLATAFTEDNPRFDRYRFMRAIGIDA